MKKKLAKGEKTMRTDISRINEQTPHQELTEGLMVFAGGTSKYFETGEWRTRTPILNHDLCRQCMVCSMVCPDSCIPLKDGERVEFDYKQGAVRTDQH